MSKKVYKYELPMHGQVHLVMPAGAELLSVGHQLDGGRLGGMRLWAMVDDRVQATEQRRLYVAQTGEELPEERKRYIGTVVMDDGVAYVVHVFELAF